MTRLVIFDLDGTLLNTIEDLAAACNHALRGCGCPERKPEEYNMMVGRGIYNLFRAALPEGSFRLLVPEDFSGYLPVCFDGYPLGFGKLVKGVVKNHYPKGLRRNYPPGAL